MSQSDDRDARFMTLALRQAELAVRRGQTPFGAVLVDRDGRLICASRRRRHPSPAADKAKRPAGHARPRRDQLEVALEEGPGPRADDDPAGVRGDDEGGKLRGGAALGRLVDLRHPRDLADEAGVGVQGEAHRRLLRVGLARLLPGPLDGQRGMGGAARRVLRGIEPEARVESGVA